MCIPLKTRKEWRKGISGPCTYLRAANQPKLVARNSTHIIRLMLLWVRSLKGRAEESASPYAVMSAAWRGRLQSWRQTNGWAVEPSESSWLLMLVFAETTEGLPTGMTLGLSMRPRGHPHGMWPDPKAKCPKTTCRSSAAF